MLDFSGEFCVSLGETTYSLTKGDVLVIKPNQPHRVEPKGPEEFKLISIVMPPKSFLTIYSIEILIESSCPFRKKIS